MAEDKEIQQNNFGVGKFQRKPQFCIEKKNPFAPFLHPPKKFYQKFSTTNYLFNNSLIRKFMPYEIVFFFLSPIESNDPIQFSVYKFSKKILDHAYFFFFRQKVSVSFGQFACAAFRMMQEKGDCAWMTKEN